MSKTRRQQSLSAWGKQKWRTKSGKKSSKTGERYLASAAIKALSAQEYAATTREKRKAKKKNTGSIIPGHGGLLDRIDGMIFALPFAYMYFNLF